MWTGRRYERGLNQVLKILTAQVRFYMMLRDGWSPPNHFYWIDLCLRCRIQDDSLKKIQDYNLENVFKRK